MESYKQITPSGSVYWYKDAAHTILHRVDGPAVEHDGDNTWRYCGMLHRLDGPAIEWGDYREWWIFGGEYSEEDFDAAIGVINQRFEGKDMKMFPLDILKEIMKSILTEEKETTPV